MNTKGRNSHITRWIALSTLFISFLVHLGLSQPIESMPESLKRSDLVLDAQVLSMESKWTEGKTSIHTLVKLKALSVIKGEIPGNEITLDIPGGTIGEHTFGFSPPPIGFKMQERAILFLKKDSSSEFMQILRKDPVYGDLVMMGHESANVDRLVNALKSSIHDESALLKFKDEMTKEKKFLNKKRTTIGTRPHPMLESVRPQTSIKDTVDKTHFHKVDRDTLHGVQ